MDRSRQSESSAPNSDAEVSLDVLPLHSTNLLTVLDEDGIVQYESPSIERIYGYEQDELVGEQVAEYFHPDDRETVTAAFRRIVASDDDVVEAVEYRHRRADGTYTWVESVASADPTPDGWYVVNTRDISDRKAREQHLETMNERLEAFASVVSHDLRNPLNVARARLQLARGDCDSDHDHLGDVANAHDRMETLIETLLTLSRSGKRVAEMESIALARVSEASWQTVATGEATLVTDTERRLRADRSRLQQLLENLIRNAVEHGSTGNRSNPDDAVEHGGPDVTVTVGDTDGGFYVEDDGSGIPTDERARLVDESTMAARDGPGLGLRIVEGIVDAHGWQLHITDGTRGGARFEITDVERSQ